MQEVVMIPEFQPFPKIPRLNREVVITEKIDGTNAVAHVAADGTVTAGSRTRWLVGEDAKGRKIDNFGFRAWVEEHAEELRRLGPGTHYGEWWGQGIQRGYGLTEKRFSLFNVHKWSDPTSRPACCGCVPVIVCTKGEWHSHDQVTQCNAVEFALSALRARGSSAAPGFMKPEGIVVFHTASGQLYKVTLEGDEKPKGAAA